MITIYLTVFIAVVGLIFLGWAYFNLSRNYLLLKKNLERVNRDLAGLCASANNVDAQISMNRDFLQKLFQENQTVPAEKKELAEPDYQEIISKVRQGMDSAELTRQCGVSFDEAALLIRLYGSEN